MSDIPVEWNEEYGLWWPEGEENGTYKWMLNRVTDVDVMVRYCRTTGVCVQAGGFVGMWPARLAKWFERVYTFEPTPHLFECVKKNTAHLPSVRVFNNALGPTMGEVELNHKRGGCSTVVPGGRLTVKQITIDSLCLIRCDAIYLDIERYELEALKGAINTIKNFKPVVMLELKEDTRAEYDAFMDALGYTGAQKIHGDKVYVPA